MPPFLKNHHIQVIWSKDGSLPADWTKENLTRWVKRARGDIIYSPKVAHETTHLVCSESTWTDNRDALASHQKGCERSEKLYIVSTDWLVDCLHLQKKRRESKYLWSKLSEKKAIDISSDDNDAVENPIDLLVKHTKKFVDKRDQAALEAKHAAEDAQRAEEQARERREQELAREYEARIRKENAALIRRGCRKSRNEIFSDEHRIYRDFENFPYEITLTKVDLAKNRNERVTITIYESNAEPHTYATNLNRAGTDRQPTNNILVAIGATFPVARRQFVRAFEELTHKTWEDRFAPSKAAEQTEAFDGRPFVYTPPRSGPRGLALYLEPKDDDAPAAIEGPTSDALKTTAETPIGVSVETDKAVEMIVAETVEAEGHDNTPTTDEPVSQTSEPEMNEADDKNMPSEDTGSSESENEAISAQTGHPTVDTEMTESEQAGYARSMSPAELDADVVISDEHDPEDDAESYGADGNGDLDVFEDLLSMAREQRNSQEHDMAMCKKRSTSVAPPVPHRWAAHSDTHDSGMSDSEGPGQLPPSRKRKWDDFFEGFEDSPAQ
ncbi:hypothetical protein AMS68_001963 [Peltaster fructicola]|uniref:Uncharacterized protein n=1 Tax=Peltaster fructicola TaxID=286661 RepID=A0A6H0XP37_9PEZI|nr:hypothetical protein AMS68_001963 [Peltaster fructicola]